jgi:carbamoyltransferase
MIILGINAYHGDSSAALLRDGALIAAAEEERFRRVKHWAGFPSHAIAYCLKEAGATLDDLDYIAVNQDSRANLLFKLRYVLTNLSSLGLAWERIGNRRERQNVPELLKGMFPEQKLRGAFHNVEHHLAHLSSAFHVSPFEDAVVVSVDGFGDFASTAWGIGHGPVIKVEGRVLFPHSLGIFYQAMTQYLGFPNYGDEYKVMGLAPYGSPTFMDDMRKMVWLGDDGRFELNLSYFSHHRQQSSYQWAGGSPDFPDLFSSALESLLGPRRRPSDPLEDRHKDIARSVQEMYEEAFFHLIVRLQRSSGLTNITLAGGCAANSVANGKIRRKTGFRRVYVQAAPGDAGGAIGSAFAIWHQLGGKRSFVMDHAYWGPLYSRNQVKSLLEDERNEIEKAKCTVTEAPNDEQLCRVAATAIADGKVVGWFHGRMEWGPRALGNRSILCDPRRGDMKGVLNEKIKRRESFRPFAPSILEEEVGNWFEEDDAVPFMMQVFQIREGKRELIPAVTHVDGSGRLQTVSEKTNPLYHRLIKTFFSYTGVPMVLNTSFNENEPVVCEPKEALDCFLRTRMDLLVIEDLVVSR